MEDPGRCRLSPSVLNMLCVAISERSTCSVALADKLHVSPATIDQYFKLALDTLEVHSRADAVLQALHLGIVPGVTLTAGQTQNPADTDT